MMRLKLHPDAFPELKEIAEYYGSIRSGLGVDFRHEVAAVLRRIRGNPQMYGRRRGKIRLAPLHRFPYSVHYEALQDLVWVAAIVHHSRRPPSKASRRLPS